MSKDIHDQLADGLLKGAGIAGKASLKYGFSSFGKNSADNVVAVLFACLFAPFIAMFAVASHAVYYDMGPKAFLVRRIAALISPFWVYGLIAVLPEAYTPLLLVPAILPPLVVIPAFIFYTLRRNYPASTPDYPGDITFAKILPGEMDINPVKRGLLYVVIAPVVEYLIIIGFSLLLAPVGGTLLAAFGLLFLGMQIVFGSIGGAWAAHKAFAESEQFRAKQEIAAAQGQIAGGEDAAAAINAYSQVEATQPVEDEPLQTVGDEPDTILEQKMRNEIYANPSYMAFHNLYWQWLDRTLESESSHVVDYIETMDDAELRTTIARFLSKAFFCMGEIDEFQLDVVGWLRHNFTDNEIDLMATTKDIDETLNEPEYAGIVDKVDSLTAQHLSPEQLAEREADSEPEPTVDEMVAHIRREREYDDRNYVQGILDVECDAMVYSLRNRDNESPYSDFFEKRSAKDGREEHAEDMQYLGMCYGEFGKDMNYVAWLDSVFEDKELERLWLSYEEWTGEVADPLISARAKISALAANLSK